MNGMTGQIKCKVGPGQFSNEWAVKGTSYDGTEFSLFAPREYVDYEKNCRGDGWLQVEILDQDATRFLVRLPRQAFEIGFFVAVNKRIMKTGVGSNK